MNETTLEVGDASILMSWIIWKPRNEFGLVADTHWCSRLVTKDLLLFSRRKQQRCDTSAVLSAMYIECRVAILREPLESSSQAQFTPETVASLWHWKERSFMDFHALPGLAPFQDLTHVIVELQSLRAETSFLKSPDLKLFWLWCSLLKVSRHFGERNVADVNNLLAQVLPECLRCGKALETLRLGFGPEAFTLLDWHHLHPSTHLDTFGIKQLGVFSRSKPMTTKPMRAFSPSVSSALVAEELPWQIRSISWPLVDSCNLRDGWIHVCLDLSWTVARDFEDCHVVNVVSGFHLMEGQLAWLRTQLKSSLRDPNFVNQL